MPPRKSDNRDERLARLEQQLERLRTNRESIVETVMAARPLAKALLRETPPVIAGSRKKR
jgi:hypothetical protein